MTQFINQSAETQGRPVAVEDTILTTALPTTAGSKMLDGYRSLFDAEVVTRLQAAGFGIAGKANVGEFGIDFLGETSFFGACETAQGELTTAANGLVASAEVEAVVGLDVNGAPRRGAALAGQVCVKPTYGTVSRFGTVPAACSGETVCVTAATIDACRDVLDAIAGHDDNDGTSLPQEQCALVTRAAQQAPAPVRTVVLAKGLVAAADEATQAAIAAAVAKLQAQGVTVTETTDEQDAVLASARIAWNMLMAAEVCNNVSRYDGVKYGYRTQDYVTIGELYTNSRTEAFGNVLKTIILFGSETLAEEKYDAYYDKGLRMRRVTVETFAALFANAQAVLMPACGKRAYTAADVAANKYLAFDENLFTAPASLTGLPAVVAGGVQLVGPALSDAALMDVAAACAQEVC